jgi:Na+-driven multidrug efflux pump
LLQWFTQDPTIVAAGCELLWFSVALETGRTFNLIVIAALRATGDSRFPLWVGMVSMPVVLAGGSWYLGIYCGWGLKGVWVAYAVDEWLRGLIMWHRWQSFGWLTRARATHRRMKQA